MPVLVKSLLRKVTRRLRESWGRNVGKYLLRRAERILPVVPVERRWGSGHKLKYRKLHLNMRNNFFLWKQSAIETGCPERLVKCLTLEILKTLLDHVLSSLLCLALPSADRLDEMISRGPFPPQLFCDSVSNWQVIKKYVQKTNYTENISCKHDLKTFFEQSQSFFFSCIR